MSANIRHSYLISYSLLASYIFTQMASADGVILPKVALGDTSNMKRLLDETVARASIHSLNMKENTSYPNFKMMIMIVSCAFAALAQFNPLTFPDNRLLLALCVVVYFGLSGVLQYFTWWGDKDSVCYTAAEVRILCGIAFWCRCFYRCIQDMLCVSIILLQDSKPSINVRLIFPKFTHEVTIIYEAISAGKTTELLRRKFNVGDYFTTVRRAAKSCNQHALIAVFKHTSFVIPMYSLVMIIAEWTLPRTSRY
jgi:hypothetical protein